MAAGVRDRARSPGSLWLQRLVMRTSTIQRNLGAPLWIVFFFFSASLLSARLPLTWEIYSFFSPQGWHPAHDQQVVAG